MMASNPAICIISRAGPIVLGSGFISIANVGNAIIRIETCTNHRAPQSLIGIEAWHNHQA